MTAAESYLDSGHFSKKGLFDQLTSEYGEGFAKKDVTFALNHVKADYNAAGPPRPPSLTSTPVISATSASSISCTSEYG